MDPKPETRGRPRLADSITAEVLALRESGMSMVDIAARCGIGIGSVHRAIVADMRANTEPQKGSPTNATGGDNE